MKLLLAAIAAVISVVNVRANIIFSQDFSGPPGAENYYNLEQPSANQWNSIFCGDIVGGALSFNRGSRVCSFTRSTDFVPTPQAIIYRFNLEVTGNPGTAPSAAVWQVGAGFGGGNGLEDVAKAHSQLTLDFGGSGSFSFHDGTLYSMGYSGRRAITWVINNSGAPLRYVGPGNHLETVQNDRWDLWVDGTRIFDGRSASAATVSLTDLKFVYKNGAGTILLDDFVIESVESVPESSATGVLAVVFVMVVVLGTGVRRWAVRR